MLILSINCQYLFKGRDLLGITSKNNITSIISRISHNGEIIRSHASYSWKWTHTQEMIKTQIKLQIDQYNEELRR